MKQTLLFRVNGQPQGKGRPRSTKCGRHYTPAKTRQYEAQIRSAAMKAAQLQGWLKSDEECCTACLEIALHNLEEMRNGYL